MEWKLHSIYSTISHIFNVSEFIFKLGWNRIEINLMRKLCIIRGHILLHKYTKTTNFIIELSGDTFYLNHMCKFNKNLKSNDSVYNTILYILNGKNYEHNSFGTLL